MHGAVVVPGFVEDGGLGKEGVVRIRRPKSKVWKKFRCR